MYRKYIKRILDIIIGSILFIILLPLILIVGIITLIDLGRPLFNHRKEKEGMNHKIFTMYKFRTSLPKKNPDDDKILTPVSKIIDITRLNELPQLINVIKGDMSLVGPRPFLANDKTLPDMEISEKRYLVRPGITGLFQVRDGSHEDKLKCDIEYYDNLSFTLDLAIVLLTPIAVFKKVKYALEKHN